MQKLLVPVLLLAIAAMSSSNVLPILATSEINGPPDFDSQQSDNTYRNKHKSRNNLDAVMFKMDIEANAYKIPQINNDFSNNFPGELNRHSKSDKYNFKGFRKEQWHNYPRRLDRLNKYFYGQENTDKRNLDPDDAIKVYSDDVENQDNSLSEMDSNEYHLENELQMRNEAAENVASAVINPLLIFKIHLSCLNKEREDQISCLDTDLEIAKHKETTNNPLNNNISGSDQNKVKREGKSSSGLESDAQTSSNNSRNKRIFSLWSRLQSLNHKGHELHHRRHLYALYGVPESEGGGVLTAETRATFMRPPGSPLRWG